MNQSSSNGFTILELLVAASLLIILTGVALESYQSAIVNAKTSRIKSEFRTYAGAIVAYTVDHNQMPRMAHASFYLDPEFDLMLGAPVNGVLSKVLTTPVAYLTAINKIDPFMVDLSGAPVDEMLYSYNVMQVYKERVPDSLFWPSAFQFYGEWRLGSVGPDKKYDHSFINSAQLPYDPTNGLISLGNIWHSPKSTFGALPPIPSVLGTHQ